MKKNLGHLLICLCLLTLIFKPTKAISENNAGIVSLGAGIASGATTYFIAHRLMRTEITPALLALVVGSSTSYALYHKLLFDTPEQKIAVVQAMLKPYLADKLLIQTQDSLYKNYAGQAVLGGPSLASIKTHLTTKNLELIDLQTVLKKIEKEENLSIELKKRHVQLLSSIDMLLMNSEQKLEFIHELQETQDITSTLAWVKNTLDALEKDAFLNTPLSSESEFNAHAPKEVLNYLNTQHDVISQAQESLKKLVQKKLSNEQKQVYLEQSALLPGLLKKIEERKLLTTIMNLKNCCESFIAQNYTFTRDFVSPEKFMHLIAIEFESAWPLVLARNSGRSLLDTLKNMRRDVLECYLEINKYDCYGNFITLCQNITETIAQVEQQVKTNLEAIVKHEKYLHQCELLEQQQEAARQREHEAKLERERLAEFKRQREHEEHLEKMRYDELKRQREHNEKLEKERREHEEKQAKEQREALIKFKEKQLQSLNQQAAPAGRTR